jgi:hypothetical protein
MAKEEVNELAHLNVLVIVGVMFLVMGFLVPTDAKERQWVARCLCFLGGMLLAIGARTILGF